MAGKVVEKDPVVKVARQRLSVLEMAEALGNISEACRRGGMDRTSFYEWKRRFQTHGFEGLKDLPPIPQISTESDNAGKRGKSPGMQPGASLLGLRQAVGFPQTTGHIGQFSNNPENPDPQ